MLSLRLFKSTWDSCCFPFCPPQGGSLSFLDLHMEGPSSCTWVGFINLLSTRICVLSASWFCRCLMVMSQLSTPSGSNQPGLFLEVALAILWASASSLAPFSLRILGPRGGSHWVSQFPEQLLLCDAIKSGFDDVYN